ncbi:MAG: hypothetical protein ACUZ77_04615 [Candidatus Brocadiales bacterium]
MRRHVWRRQLLSFVCLFILLTVVFSAIQPVAEAQVTVVGSWDVTGKRKICAKGLGCSKGAINDSVEVFPDGSVSVFDTFFSITVKGTWFQKKTRKFRIDFDKSDAAVLLQAICENEGLSCADVIVSKARATIKLKKNNDKFKGNLRFTGRASINGKSRRFKLTGRFKGTRTGGP